MINRSLWKVTFVGMVCIQGYKEHPEVSFIGKLGVLPEFSGEGIGKKLMEACELKLKKNNVDSVELFVIVDKEDTRIVDYYKKQGFVIIEFLENDITGHDGRMKDVYQMRKTLG